MKWLHYGEHGMAPLSWPVTAARLAPVPSNPHRGPKGHRGRRERRSPIGPSRAACRAADPAGTIQHFALPMRVSSPGCSILTVQYLEGRTGPTLGTLAGGLRVAFSRAPRTIPLRSN